MSRVRIDFVGHLRTLAGEENMTVELTEEETSLGSILESAEETHGDLKLFDEGGLKKGILVFRRNETGGLERVADLSLSAARGNERDPEYVIATGMEGG